MGRSNHGERLTQSPGGVLRPAGTKEAPVRLFLAGALLVAKTGFVRMVDQARDARSGSTTLSESLQGQEPLRELEPHRSTAAGSN